MINPITKENYSKQEVAEMAYNVKHSVIAKKDFAYTISVIIHSYEIALQAVKETAYNEGWNAELRSNMETAEKMLKVWQDAFDTIKVMDDALL